MTAEEKKFNFHLWLDHFRWMAAFVVLFTHSTNRFMMPVSEIGISDRTYFHYLVSFFSGFSHQAVMVFFVLSGYLVGGSLISEWRKNGDIDYVAYLVKRFSRLWTVLIPVFLVTYLINVCTLLLIGSNSSSFYPLDIYNSQDSISFLCNLLFLQTALCRPFGANGPLWSIFNEFWYYIAALLIALSFQRKIIFWGRFFFGSLAFLLLFALTFIQFDGSNLILYSSIWMLGAMAAGIKKTSITSIKVSALLFLAFLLGIRLLVRRDFWDQSPLGTFALDFFVALLFSNMLVSMATRLNFKGPPLGGLNSQLAAFSFTLYCMHAPILNSYGSLMERFVRGVYRQNMSSIGDWVFLFFPICLSLILSFLLYLLAEKHTPVVRDFSMSLLNSIKGIRRGRY